MSVLEVLHILVLSAVLTAAVVPDLRDRRIPNKVTVPGLALGLVLGVGLEGGLPILALTGASLALALSVPFVLLGALGAGDAKLLTVVGAFLGPGGLLPAVLYAALAGAVMAAVSALLGGVGKRTLADTRDLVVYFASFGRRGGRNRVGDSDARTVPYGVAIACGAVLAVFFPFYLGG
jgi:prepilin peptidase CpaA